MDLDDFQSMKYRDLKGIKVNQPKAELIKNQLDVNKEGDEMDLNSTFEVEEKPEELLVNKTFEKDDVNDELNATFEKEAYADLYTDEMGFNSTFDVEEKPEVTVSLRSGNIYFINKMVEKEDSNDELNATFEKEANADLNTNDTGLNTTFEVEEKPEVTVSMRSGNIYYINKTVEKEDRNDELNTSFEKEACEKINTTFEKEVSDVNNESEPKPSSRFVEFIAEENNNESSPTKRYGPNVILKPSVSVQARKIATPRRIKKPPKVWTPAKTYLDANPPTVANTTAAKTPKASILAMTYLMPVSMPTSTPSQADSAQNGKPTSEKNTPSRTPGKTPSRAMLSNKKKTPTTATNVEKLTKIPRFTNFAKKAPNLAKLHEKQFNKLPSLVDTIDRKRKRTESVQEQIKRVKTISHQKIVSQYKSKIPVAIKPKGGPKFVPSITSTAKMNLNFGGNQTAPNTFNFSAEKVAGPVIQKMNKEPRKNLKSTSKNSVVTAKNKPDKPVFKTKTTVNKTFMNITNKSFINKSITASSKATFDIKASLAKPLTYKPHLGKLKPLEDKKKVVGEKNGGMTFTDLKKKQQQVIKGARLNKRAELLMQKRNME